MAALLACAAVLVATGLTAATADARTTPATKVVRAHFHGGAGCGDTDTVTVRLPRGARHVRAVRPKRGALIPDEAQPGQVSKITRIKVSRRRVTWAATSGGSVCWDAAHEPRCIDPDSNYFCGPGWSTHTTRFVVRFRRPVHR